MQKENQKYDAEFYSNLFLQSPALIVVGDLNCQCIYTNRYTANLFSYRDQESMLGISPYDMRCPAVENADEFMKQNQEVMDTGKELTMLDIHTYSDSEVKVLLT